MTDTTSPGPREVAKVLAEIGLLLELHGESSFRARAFTNAARALEGLEADLQALAKQDRLTSLKGVGAGIAGVIKEFVLTGRSDLLEELTTKTPLGLYDLLRIPGLGPKRIHTLHQELGVDGLDALEEAAAAGKVAALSGFGAKTAAKIVEGIAFARASRRLRRYPQALEIAVTLLEGVRSVPEVTSAEIVGAVRRRMEIVDRIEMLAAAEHPVRAAEALRAVYGSAGEAAGAAAAAGAESLAQGEVILRLSDGVTARVRCVAREAFVAATVWETGNAKHVGALADLAADRGLEFGKDGLRADGKLVPLERESELYDRLGLAYVPPELREGLGEVERAGSGELPKLVELEDLHGTFHCHTTYSDGKATIEEMGSAARDRGWSYLGLADHSRAAAYAGGLSIERVRAQQAEIDGFNEAHSVSGATPFRIFKGIESDILPDGSLDYPDDVLGTFDYVVGSVHSAFGMARAEMTKRVIRAVKHPSLTILGHPTGRLLLRRDGYEIDIPAVLEAAADAGVVIEINANPNRLDLDWRHVRTAAEMGIVIAINPDAHSVRELDNLAFGINMARKAGLEPRQVLNTWPLDEVTRYLAERK
ncbi:MAG: DNA polymerase/3'-5' exonuclease PolX [Gemmatimonadota bacterium]